MADRQAADWRRWIALAGLAVLPLVLVVPMLLGAAPARADSSATTVTVLPTVTRPVVTTPAPTVPATTAAPLTTATTVPRIVPVPTTVRTYITRPFATVTSTSTTSTTIAGISSHVSVVPATVPLATKGTNGHMSPVFAWLSGIGAAIAALIVGARLFMTRAGGADRAPYNDSPI